MEKPQQRVSSNQASPNTTRKYTAQETIEIYTDWANHYLEKARSKKRIHDLQTDISDGVVLCDIIEAVTNQKIPDINRKPKTSSQMLENVSVCLSLLESLGVATEGVTARDVREGSLKSILGLFFALSRFKQRQRRELQQKQLQEAIMPRLPSPFNKHGATSIPVPASVAARRGATPIGKCGGASRPSSPGIGSGNGLVNCSGGGGGVVTSLIPTPRSASRTDKPINQIKSATGTGARSLRPPSYTSSGSTNVMLNHSGSGQSTLERGMKHPQNVVHSNPNVPSSGVATTTSNSTTPSSVLDKFKFFNSPPRSTKQGPVGSKRTSSSSGFSSARSERSDSSASINSDARLPQGYVLPMSPPSPQDSSRNQHKNKTTKVHVNSPRNSRKTTKKTPSYSNLSTESDLQNSRDSSNSRYVESLSPKTDMKSNHRSKMNIESSSSIPKPTAAVKGTSKVMPDKIKSTNNGAADSYLRKPLKDSVAMVCPMPLISESTSPAAVSSPSGVQVAMFAKGVRPGETPSPTQAPPSSTQQQCVGVTVVGASSDTLHLREFDLHQQQPQHQPTNILADKGVPSETLQVTADTVNASTIDDEEAGMRVKPMQPLSYVRPGIFNGDRQRTCFMPEILRLSRRNGTFLSGSHFADLDMAAGYLSDGEVLRGGGSSGSLLEPADGYLSEGAASLYMRRAMRDSLEDDSSSLSSEVSEPLNELSEERHLEKKRLPDNNICETQINGYTNSPGGPGGELDSSGPHQHHHHHQQQQQQQQQGLRPVLKVVSSRQLVKKADSSQQTESSAFRQGNHWKRYPIPEGGNGGSSGGSGKPSLESRPELRRGKSDLGEQREKSREKNRDRVDKLQQERAAAVVNGGGSSRSHQGERSRRSQGAKDEERRSSSRGSQGGSSSKGSGGGVTLQQQSSGSEASSPGSSRPRGGGNGNNSHHVRVPASFGYVSKRANSNVSVCSNRSHTSSSANGKANDDLSRTAQVSAVPRNSESNTNSGQRPRHSKVKISGGTQTTSSDINPSPVEYNTTPSPSRRGSSSSYKSYSLTAPTASQLSANVRERLLLVGGNSHSLPKASNAGNTSLPNEYAHALFASSPRTGPRAGARFTDGSLSDTTGYSNYSELTGNTGGNSGNGYYGVPGVGSPYSWLRHSSTYNASIATARCNAANSSLTESTDSLSSLGSQHRTSLSHARILMHPRDGSPGPRLNRSNSIRSTKSEKLYPSMLQRSEDLLLDSYYNSVLSASTTGPSQTMHRPAPDSQASQPTSPTPSQGNNRFNFPLSSSASSHGLSRPTTMSPYLISSKISCKDDEMHGSSLSLVSTASSLYSTAEEKQAHEIRKLRRELMEAQDKVHTLTNQLSTNAHVVSAFEQSLSNMTQRLQQLTASAEKKDSELLELRHTIHMLRQHSMDAGLTQLQQGSNMARQLSTDSVSSLSSACSGASHVSGRRGIPGGTSSKKKKGWLRSSFSKAFSRTKKSRHGSLSLSDVEDGRTPGSELSAPSSPMLQSHKHHSLALASAQLNNDALKLSHSSSAIYGQEIEGNGPEVVHELRKQLREKDLVLTDIRLEALSSAHQLESLKDTVLKMRNEMMSLKQDNERLQRIVTSKSLTSSQSSLPITDSLERRFSMSDTPALATLECTTVHGDPDGRLVGVAVLLGGKHVCGAANVHELGEDGAEWRVANIGVGGKMQWEALDALVRRVFKEYVLRVDPVSNLGLSADSVYAYHVGEITRVLSEGLPKTPELLPYGYLIGEEISIKICIKTAQHSGSVDAMAFETLIPKSIVQRYVSLLSEHRRIILCGPSGTGKSFLANKLAQYLVLRDNREPTPEVIATFNVDHKSSKELRQYLANIAEQCENNASDLPSVIILDNLHNAGSLGEIFNGFLNTKYTKCPYIIGTMNQATCSTTNLQLHHNFRWVLCANHMEPVKGFLARFLKRRLMETEIKNIQRNPELARIFEWIPKVWNHLNKFLETHSSSDVTIGPRLFLSCPAELAGSQVWFTDLWNYSVVPYLLEAVREGLQLYGRRGAWEDPTRFITQTYPWSAEAVHGGADALIRLRPEDVGYDIQATLASASTSPPGPGGNLQAHAAPNTDNEGDPLLNMLMRLQEAANYSSPHDGMDSSDSANSGERDSRETDREGEQDVEDHEGE